MDFDKICVDWYVVHFNGSFWNGGEKNIQQEKWKKMK